MTAALGAEAINSPLRRKRNQRSEKKLLFVKETSATEMKSPVNSKLTDLETGIGSGIKNIINQTVPPKQTGFSKKHSVGSKAPPVPTQTPRINKQRKPPVPVAPVSLKKRESL